MLSDRKRAHVDGERNERWKKIWKQCIIAATPGRWRQHWQQISKRRITFSLEWVHLVIVGVRRSVLLLCLHICAPHIHTPFHTRFGSVRNFETGFQTARWTLCCWGLFFFHTQLLFIFGTQNLIALFCLPIEQCCLLPFRCSLNPLCSSFYCCSPWFTSFIYTLCGSINIYHWFAQSTQEFADRWIVHSKTLPWPMARCGAVFLIYLVHFVTSVVKSQSGDGVRRFVCASLTDGEELGSSGITANRPRCTHGDVGPYVPWIEKFETFFLWFHCSVDCIHEKLVCRPLNSMWVCVWIRGIITKTRVTQTMQFLWNSLKDSS